ncbi:MAG: DUF3343 domain-containing protein [Spirochaetes bacterium]|nr:DUF3343 domain-containing protein [Spirochaetota bacterium]
MSTGFYRAVLFRSVNHTMRAESILKKAGIPHKLIPVPREISSDCGVCLRVEERHLDDVKGALSRMEEEWSIADLVSPGQPET